MSDIIIHKINDVNIRVECDPSISMELSEYFQFRSPGYKFQPLYKTGVWDGYIRLFKRQTSSIYYGLIPRIVNFAKHRKYKIKINTHGFYRDNQTKEDIISFLESINPTYHDGNNIVPLTPHDYQIDAIQHVINTERSLLLSSTSSGKSFIIYGLIRYIIEKKKIQPNKKILLIVPSINLVNQMYSDFQEYSHEDSFDIEENTHRICQGAKKTTDKSIVISTWQSIQKMNKQYFKQYDAVFMDECHLGKAKCLCGIMEKLETTRYRTGLTGTLDDTQINKLTLEGLFGMTKVITTTKETIDAGLCTDLLIQSIVLQYSDEDRQLLNKAKYQDEIDFICSNNKRNEFLTNLAISREGNTLLLFNFVEKHGIPLYEMIKDKAPKDKHILLVHGKIDGDKREQIRKFTESNNNVIIVASIGTFNQGVNIKNLHHLILAHPSKGRIRVLQGIGRLLRKFMNKEIAIVYDIADDLSYKKYKNHTLKHFIVRMKIYNKEKFNYKMNNFNLF